MKSTINKRNEKYIYVIKDLDGHELAKGLTIAAACNYIGCSKSTLSMAIKEGRSLIKKKYLVNRYLEKDYYAEKVKKNKRPTKFQKEYNSVKWHLDIYGNTIVWKDPKKIIKELEFNGYEVSVEHRDKKVTKYITSDSKSIEILDERWIITLIKKGE